MKRMPMMIGAMLLFTMLLNTVICHGAEMLLLREGVASRYGVMCAQRREADG